jgi:integrase
MALTNTALLALKPREKNYTVTDRDGLYIEVLTSGSMVWRYKYYFLRKREKLTIGKYPAIGLADARKLRDAAAKTLEAGVSPAKAKQAGKVAQRIEAGRAHSFEELAERWFSDDVMPMSEKWRYTVRNWLELDILPAIGGKDPRRLVRADIDAILNKIVARNAPSSANKVRVICSKVFEYGIAKEELEINPVARIAPTRTPETRSHRALTVEEIGPFLRELENASARPVNTIAIQLLLLTFTRKDELRLAQWKEFDLDNGVWSIPAHRMKMGKPHRVYLSSQALGLLHKLKLMAGTSSFVLPNQSTSLKPIGHTTINSVIDRLDINGARFVPHGFRATASSILNEAGFRPEIIERQLAHADRNTIRAVYNQAEYAHERREMLQWWADYVQSLRHGSNVIPINARRQS